MYRASNSVLTLGARIPMREILPAFPVGNPPNPPIPEEQRLIPRIVRLKQGANFLRSIPHNVFFGLNCIRPAMVAVDNMDRNMITRLSQNKIYAQH